ncbi:MAG: amidohydrolase family protein [Gemmatimonadota bacterium]|nr:amidohydrolase family protein [Gemmatimonadota bacterium]MDH5759856.1 amidohydrolase family protein [Gemmatimonadota bacterium]
MQRTQSGFPLGAPILATLLGVFLSTMGLATPARAQLERVALKPSPSETRSYGELAEGPYERLVLRNVMVIPGHGGPAVGPYDILVTGNVIAEMRRHDRNDPERMQGDRIIQGDNLYVMPGMLNLHLHLREEALPLDYVFYMQLATGVTSIGPAEEGRVQDILEAERNNDILAPRQFPIYGWGSKTDYSEEELMNPEMAPQIAREMIANGVRQVYLNSLCWNPTMFGAAAQAIEAAGGVTGVHIQPGSTSQVNALDAARLGVSMIVHHYGYAESALNRQVQNYPVDYNFWDENHRFREAAQVWIEAGENPETRQRLLNDVVDSLVYYGVTMQPNRATYEANRDIIRAQGLPWHEKYTHQALWDWHLPNPDNHASFQYNWTSLDEYRWHYMYDLWGDLIYEFNKRGGRVAYGTDDNYQWSTGGFGNIRELQLVLESGMHPLEVLRSATYNSAEFLMEPKLGMVQKGYIADLLVVDGSPAENFRYLYPFGAINMDPETREMYRTRGIIHTIKDGVVMENDKLMEEVARIVAESKEGVEPDIVTKPFVVAPPVRPIGDGR